MENYLMLNGKRIDLTAEQIETLVGKKEKDPFERVERGKIYYFVDYDGRVEFTDDCFAFADDNRYKVGNYCTDEELMEQRALHETLNRLLWRYSMQNGGEKLAVSRHKYWHIVRFADGDFDAFENDSNDYWTSGIIWFDSYESATVAIEEIVKPFMEKHPEFRW